ncbi:MAG: DUF4278 domain-containing protein [Cyanobacteria bacterium P01_C01_bin.121]
MKLTYRGIQYDYNPPMLEVTESEIACKYRGQATTYSYVRHVPIPQPAETLRYRGVAYQTTRHGQVQQLSDTTPATPALAKGTLSNLRNKLTGTSAASQARRELLSEASRLHQSNIARSLEHRIKVAKEQGNQPLLAQLESEMRQSA